MEKVKNSNNILAVDTSTQKLSMSLYCCDKNETFSYEECVEDHSENLIKFFDHLLKKTKLKVENITHVGVNTGPGSFTGLRIGLSFVKTLAMFLNIKVITTTSFFMLLFETIKSWSFNNRVYNVTTLFPSVKNEFYFCKFYIKDKKISSYNPAGYIRNTELNKLENSDILIYPDFVELNDKERLFQRENSKKVIFSSETIIKMFLSKQKELYKEISYKKLVPFYLRHTYY